MVGTKSRGYSDLGRLSEGEYSMPFFVPVTALVEGATYSYEIRSGYLPNGCVR